MEKIKQYKNLETCQLDMLRKTLAESCGIKANRKGAISLILYNLNKYPQLVRVVVNGQNCAK